MKTITIFLFFIAAGFTCSHAVAGDEDNAVTIGDSTGLSTDPGEEGLTYRLGVRDLIQVEIFQVEELNHEARVNSQGFISLPLIGNLKVSGLTTEETERLIETKLAEPFIFNENLE